MERKYDVIVVGGGWGGVCAAVAAARQGARTLILEKGICFGGTATCGEVCELDGSYTRDGRCVLPQIGREIVERGIERGAMKRYGYVPMTANPAYGCDRIRFNPEELKLILDDVILEAGVTVLFMSAARAVRQTEEGVEICIDNSYGEFWVSGKVVVDATGNSEVFYLLNPETTEKTEPEKRQGVTMIYRLGNVDLERYLAGLAPEKLAELLDKGMEEGALTVRILATCPLPGMTEISVSTTRAVNVDVEDPESYTRGILETRAQVERSIPFLKANMAGLENAYLSSLAGALGVRERRRIRGLKQLTGEDVISARKIDDAVAFGCYPVDIHRDDGNHAVQFTDIGGNGIYPIPYGSMVSAEYSNVIVGCKALCSDEIAFAAHRTMPSVMGVGNAAGVAAALAARESLDLRTLDVRRVQEILRPEYPDCQELF
ncbi:MAG: FAD-dependent oxidoreductase [Lachnospiraceae bacterium]|nr:FAD-dependent oxidoreductase [Lachnospiraceae bacterium]